MSTATPRATSRATRGGTDAAPGTDRPAGARRAKERPIGAARPNLLAYLVLGLGLIAVMSPFAWMAFSSVKTEGEIRRVPPTWWPQTPTLENFRELFDRLDFPQFFTNSTIVAVAVTLGNLVFCSMLGYVLAKSEFAGKTLLFRIVLGTLMIPGMVTLVPLFVLVANLGLVNTYFGLILPFLAAPFGVFLMRQFFLGIPDELIDAARVDGASEARIFVQVVMPLAKPALATLAILTFLGSWNNFLWPLVVATSEDKYTLPVALALYSTGQNQINFGLLLAGAVVVVVPGPRRVPAPAAVLRAGRRDDRDQVSGAGSRDRRGRLDAGGGLRALVVDGGALASLATDDVELVQHAASAFEPGLLQLWVRDRGRAAAGGTAAARCRLRAPGSGPCATACSWCDGGAGDGDVRTGTGRLHALTLHPERPAWAWHVEVTHDGPEPREVDVVHAHDVALAAPGALRANELYVSQYLDLTPLDGPTGTALAVRQNLAQSGRHPWCVLACDRPGGRVGHRRARRPRVVGAGRRRAATAGRPARAPAAARAHARRPADRADRARGRRDPAGDLRRAARRGPPGRDRARRRRARRRGRSTSPAARWRPRRPPSTRGPVAGRRDRPVAGPDRRPSPPRAARTTGAASCPPGRSTADELRERWPGTWRVVERDDDGEVLSFFAGDEHVVTRAKELAVLRPHGTLLRTGDRAAPDPDGPHGDRLDDGLAAVVPDPRARDDRPRPDDGPRLPRPPPRLRPAAARRGRRTVAAARPALGLRHDPGLRPVGARRRPGRRGDPGGTIEVRTHLPAAEHRARPAP